MKRSFQIRCPRLGGEVTLAYCGREGGDLPCRRIISCWSPFLPIEEHLKKALSPEQWRELFGTTPQEKIAGLIEIIEEAAREKEK